MKAASERARRVRGMGEWIGRTAYGAPGSLYHDDGFCTSPMVAGTLSCPECRTGEYDDLRDDAEVDQTNVVPPRPKRPPVCQAGCCR